MNNNKKTSTTLGSRGMINHISKKQLISSFGCLI